MADRRSATTASKAKGGGKPGKAQGRPDRVNTRSSSSSKKNRNAAGDDDGDDDDDGDGDGDDAAAEKEKETPVPTQWVSEALQCPVCFDVMNVPVTLHCGHSACKACLESCFASRSACPTCRAEVSYENRRSLSVNIAFRDLIAEAYPDLAAEREVERKRAAEEERKRAAEEEAARPRAAPVLEGGRTPLHNASRDGDLDEVRRLLEAGADIEARDNEGETPLHDACWNGHLEIARLLLDRGADATAVDNDGETPFGLAIEYDHQEVAELLRHT